MSERQAIHKHPAEVKPGSKGSDQGRPVPADVKRLDAVVAASSEAASVAVAPRAVVAPEKEKTEVPEAPEAPESAASKPAAPGLSVPHDDPLADCLVMLTEIHGSPMSAEALKAGLPLVDNTLTPALFIRAAARAGLSARIVKRNLREISPLTLPCVLLLEDRRACVLTRYLGKDKAEVIFPETGAGVSEITIDDLAKTYTGNVLFARPQYRFDTRTDTLAKPQHQAWFWGTIATSWRIYIEVVGAAFLVNLFALASPLFIMNVYDRVVPNSAIETLWVLALGAITVFGFDFCLRTLRGYFVDIAGKKADVIISSRIFEQVLGIRMDAMPASSGALASQLREFETLRDFFTSATLVSLIDLPFVFLFISIILYVGGPVAFIPLTAVPIVIGAGLVLQMPLNTAVRQTFREASQKHALLVEAIGGMETVKSTRAESRLQRNWERFVGLTAKSSMRSRLLASVGVNFTLLASNLVTVGVVILGVYQISQGLMTVGALVASTILSGRAMAPLAQIAGLLTRYHQSMASLSALDKIMKTPVERPTGKAFLHRPTFRGGIEFKDVVFRYPGNETKALDKISFRIEPGERVGIIGRIGCGKSTIERLMLGVYEPVEGAVLVDGTDLRQIDPADLRRNVGCVPQDVYLFFGSVRDNIALGAPHADDTAILHAASVAGVDDFIRHSPSGYDLAVGERGMTLSGGQRQAIAIARALVVDPPMLVFDEPTSSMDNRSEELFKERLKEVLPGKTLVLITHRASLLSLVDRLIVIDSGKAVADGPKDKVLQALGSGKIRTAV
ncbi:MAG: type I secretion system permease/ATPase [Alphaproteobacteria bacterium]